MKDKRTMMSLVLGVATLVLLSVGATFAYFTFNSQNNFGTQVIDTDVEDLGSGVTLTNVNNELALDIKATDMLNDKIGSTYYASGSETPAQIAKMSVDGAGAFNCTYTIEVVPSTSDAENYLINNVSNDGELVLSIDGEDYDLNDETLFVYDEETQTNKLTHTGTIKEITSAEDGYITANLALKNLNVDQSALAGDNVTLTMNVASFNCTYDDVNRAGTKILARNTTSESLGELYRYQGESADNYICFGTSDKDTCVANQDKYLYRIIGIVSEDNETLELNKRQLKIIKDTPLDQVVWNSTDSTWENSNAYAYLQGENYLGNTELIPTLWLDKIDSVKWYTGNVTTAATAEQIYTGESSSTTTGNSKVGLMYASDYLYTGHKYNNHSWLYTDSQWTMSKSDIFGIALSARDLGYIQTDVNTQLNIRPVLYLNDYELFVSGSGTKNDPIILNEPQTAKYGDVAGPVAVNGTDQSLLLGYVNGTRTLKNLKYARNADLDGNGTINEIDYCIFYLHFSGTITDWDNTQPYTKGDVYVEDTDGDLGGKSDCKIQGS